MENKIITLGGTIMLFKWFLVGAIIGLIMGIFMGGFPFAIGVALIVGAGFVALRKWVFRTFWG
jgi:adenine/guanine phosphoribosyltransferase-like PRPP-binding protein